MRRRPQGRPREGAEIPNVCRVREPRSTEEAAAVRLRSVLTGPALPATSLRDRRAAPEASGSPPGGAPPGGGSLGDLARAGEPLRWSDVIPAWPDDVDLDPASAPAPMPSSPEADPDPG